MNLGKLRIVHKGFGWSDNPLKIVPRNSERSSPYRKPTQVVEESILRRSSDSWLRNEAK